MTLSPARTFRAALWRVSSADSSPNCKTGLAGDSFGPVWALTKLWNGAVHTARQCERGNTLRAVRGRRARMNRGTERSGKPWGSIEAHTFACCPPEHFSSAWRNVKTPDSMRRADAVGQHVLTAVTSLPSRPIEDVRAGSNPAALTNCRPKPSLLCGVAAEFIRALGGRDIAIRTRTAKPTATGNSRTASGHALSLTFAVSTPEGRGISWDMSLLGREFQLACVKFSSASVGAHTTSRYQARPDCNPSPKPVQPSFCCDDSSPSTNNTPPYPPISLDRLSFPLAALTTQ